ncbi:MAG: response regulator [Saprospiraceae bacterium]
MKRILLIEDTEEIRENVAEILELHSYHIIAACDGLQGLHLALEHLPDVIICDVKMPKMTGFELLAVLRGKPETAGIPFIFISASAQKSDIEKGRESGAFAYLTKPFTSDDLLRLVRNVT